MKALLLHDCGGNDDGDDDDDCGNYDDKDVDDDGVGSIEVCR